MSEAIRPALAALAAGERPNAEALADAFASLLRGEATAAQIGACLMGLERIGLGVDTLVAGAGAMRAAMNAVEPDGPTVDVCGTGGDGAHTLNISTAVSFVIAGCGLTVAKHGNRAASSKAGAADVLEALGVNLANGPSAAPRALAEARVAFLFAQAHHPAMRHVAPARRELGFRTVFNLLGPLSNPARAARQLVGVYAEDKVEMVAEALGGLGCERALVVHGHGGLDEVSLSGPTRAALWDGTRMTRLPDIAPADAGLAEAPIDAIRGGDAAFNAQALTALLDGAPGPYRDSVVLNAAAALFAFGEVETIADGAARARAALDDGSAKAALGALVRVTNEAAS